MMLNFECIDNKDGLAELCFTDDDGDEVIKIIVSPKTACEMSKEIMKKFSYAASLKRS